MYSILRSTLLEKLDRNSTLDLGSANPAVVLLVGVNGSGKTTTAANLRNYGRGSVKKKCRWWQQILYRAAATDQSVWGDRLKIPVISSVPDADPGAVAYDGNLSCYCP